MISMNGLVSAYSFLNEITPFLTPFQESTVSMPSSVVPRLISPPLSFAAGGMPILLLNHHPHL